MKLVVVIPSRGRSDTLPKHTLKLMPDAYVTVDEREMDDYAKVVPVEQLVPHPTMSMNAISTWMIDWFEEKTDADCLVTAYDDLIQLRSVVGWRPRVYTDPALIRQLLEVTAVCAMDAGCALFGFSGKQDATHYTYHYPWHLTGYIRNVIGFVRDSGLRFDPWCRLHGDVDVALQSLMKHRIIWRDDRFVFLDAPMASNKGGQPRTTEEMAEADRKLVEKWGAHVKIVARLKSKNRGAQRTVATVINVPRRDPAV